MLMHMLMLDSRRPMHQNPTSQALLVAALALVAHMFCLAGIYACLEVHVVALFQVLIYVGAVMVFMVFVIMLPIPLSLVGILPAPNTFNPVRDYETAVQFRDRVINRMVAQELLKHSGLLIDTADDGALPLVWRLALVTGGLGGLTTFSAFSAESLTLLLRGQFGLAMLHSLAHVAGGLLAAALGWWLGRLWLG